MSCFNNVSMVQCNAHMLINNVLHDRLFKTKFSAANADWLSTLEDNLLCNEETGSLFYFGTQLNKAVANVENRAVGTDIWALFLMIGACPNGCPNGSRVGSEMWYSREMSPMFKSTNLSLRRNLRQTKSRHPGPIAWPGNWGKLTGRNSCADISQQEP